MADSTVHRTDGKIRRQDDEHTCECLDRQAIMAAGEA